MSLTESPRSKEKMIEFLKNHFRYFTMHSWNRSTSYAKNIKIYKLGLIHETERKCYEMLEVPDAFSEFEDILSDFAVRHEYTRQIIQNGRSGGYLVLARGGRKMLDYKTRCDTCARPTWYEEEKPCHVTGCEGTLRKLKTPLYEHFVYSGRGMDDEGELEDLSHEELGQRAVLVKDFDLTCERAVRAFVHFALRHALQEEEIMVPKKIKVAVQI